MFAHYHREMRRSDAVRNFESILDITEQLLTEEGLDLKLSHVAQRADLGQGTLYRHFPTRFALLAQVFRRRLDRYESFVQEHSADPELFLTLLRRVAADQQTTRGFLEALRAEPESEEDVRAIVALRERTTTVFGRALSAAQATGAVREDLEGADVHVILQMLLGAGNSAIHGDRDAAMSRALAILERGIR